MPAAAVAKSPPRQTFQLRLATVVLLGGIAVLMGGGHGGRLSAQPQPATAIDGDTLQIDGEVVQLFGIDAPELGQLCKRGSLTWHCGREAAEDLQKRIDLGGGRVDCRPPRGASAADATPFPARVCEIGQEDLALAMVETGYAVALPAGGPGYQDAQAYAKEAGIGIWRGTFDLPEAWRLLEVSDPDRWQASADCLVKGSIDAAGERLYAVPLDRGYRQIELDPARGERAFCSDEDASAAGWRRPGEP